MLERFKVPKEDEVRVPEPSLRETVTAIFEKMGVPSDQAATGSDTLVMSDLRGVETHGRLQRAPALCRAVQRRHPEPQTQLADHQGGPRDRHDRRRRRDSG